MDINACADKKLKDNPQWAERSHEFKCPLCYDDPANIKSAQQQEPVAIEYWLQDTMESGRWVKTDNMAKATAEKMLSGEYGDVYPQGRIVEPSPPASKPWVGLTEKEENELWESTDSDWELMKRTEAKLREKNA